MAYPEKLQVLIDALSEMEDRADRIEVLRSYAARLRPVPAEVATRPYPQSHLAPHCESQAYLWVSGPRESPTIRCAVENPQGISAQALGVVMVETLEGQPASVLAQIPDELVYDLFGRELSIGKTMGLMGMVQCVRKMAAELDP